MKSLLRKPGRILLLASFFMVFGYSTLAQIIPSVPDPMHHALTPSQAYPVGLPPLPPGVDPQAKIQPNIPVVIRPEDNLYAYTNANPTNATDTNGLSPTIVTVLPPESVLPGSSQNQSCPAPKNNNMTVAGRDCYAECAHLLPSPSGDLQSSEFRKCYGECTGRL